MILSDLEQQPITTEDQFAELLAEIRQLTNLQEIDIDTYYSLANAYQLPLHLTYLIIYHFKKGSVLTLENLSSVSFYAICKDILTPYKNKAYTFQKIFNLRYPYLKNTDERLVWYLKHPNGLTLTQKVAILEGETSFNRMGVGRTRFEQALKRINFEATHETIEKRRLTETYGEWPAAVATFIKKERGDLTTAEVLAIGDALAEESKSTIKMAIFSYILSRMGKIEVYFLASQVNRFHDQVSRTSSLVRAFSKAFNIDYKMLERLISMHSMVDVAVLIDEGKRNLLEQFERIIPFRSFKPMLAEKWERQNKFPAFAEAKYDGVRLLVHKLGNKIGGFSRRRTDYTYKYPRIAQMVNYLPVFSIILDGEITAQQWTVEGPRYLNPYELHEVTRQSLDGIKLIYVIFDVIFLNGVELVSWPFEKRRQLRHQLFNAIKARGNPPGIEIREVQSVEVHNQGELINAYNNYIDTRHEGAIVKDPNGTYDLGKRSKYWYKLKPKETLDVTITGIIPLQEEGQLRVWGIRYAVLRGEEEYVNLGMIRGLDLRAGTRLAELILSYGLIPPNAKLMDLTPDIESRGRFTQVKESWGFEIEPKIVITIDSLGIVRQKDEKFSLRNARFLYIREDMPVEDISDWQELYQYYMKTNT